MASKYFVFHTDRDPRDEENLYPLEGKGYSFKTAKDYARIASAHGDPTEVYRGRPTLTKNRRGVKTGKRVRRYEDGQRVFPFVPDDLVHPLKLTKAEVPRTLKRFEKPLGMAANPVVGTPQPTATLQVVVYKSGADWVGQLQSKHKDMMYREMLSEYGQRDAFDNFALITFPRKPKMTQSQNRQLREKGEAAVRMSTPKVEELIDSTWNVDIFPWKHNPAGEPKMTRDQLLRTINTNDFMSQYVDTMLWSTNDESDDTGGEPLEDNYDLGDFTVEGLKTIISDCQEFLAKPGVQDAIDDTLADDKQAGHDFWLTRVGHGAGFWDGDWPEPEASLLTEASEEMGEVWVYVGDNGRLYFS